MKKLLSIIFIVFFLFPLGAYEIETSKGIKTVTIPEDKTMEEAFLTMAKLYLEESYDHGELLEETEKLTEEIEKYKTLVQEKENLYIEQLENYNDLKKTYEKTLKPEGIIPSLNIGMQYSLEDTSKHFHVQLGVILFERINFYTIVSYPPSIGISLGAQL